MLRIHKKSTSEAHQHFLEANRNAPLPLGVTVLPLGTRQRLRLVCGMRQPLAASTERPSFLPIAHSTHPLKLSCFYLLWASRRIPDKLTMSAGIAFLLECFHGSWLIWICFFFCCVPGICLACCNVLCSYVQLQNHYRLYTYASLVKLVKFLDKKYKTYLVICDLTL